MKSIQSGFLFLLWVVMLATGPMVSAKAASVVTTEQVKAELLVHAPEGLRPGAKAWLGLKIVHKKGWHTYWLNPGDAGAPTDEEIAALDASLPHQPVHVGAVLTGLREPRGPWGPGRPVEAADAFEAVRVIARACGVDVRLRAAQYLPWHPGRCAEVLVDGSSRGTAPLAQPIALAAGLQVEEAAHDAEGDSVEAHLLGAGHDDGAHRRRDHELLQRRA